MRRLVAGGLAFGLTAAGALTLGLPAGAQGIPGGTVLEATLSPTVVAPGGDMTAASVEPCRVPDEGDPGVIYWSVWEAGQYMHAHMEENVPLGADGSWSVTFPAPHEAGAYELFAVCIPTGGPTGEAQETLQSLASEAPQAPGDEDEPPGDPSESEWEYYGPLSFTVESERGHGEHPTPVPTPTPTPTPTPEPTPTPTPEPPVVAPARPVVAEPTYTG